MSTKNFACYGDLETLFSGINTKKVSKSSTNGLIRNDGSIDKNTYDSDDNLLDTIKMRTKNKKYAFLKVIDRTFTGLSNFYGSRVWYAGEDIYYSYNGTNKKFNKFTDTWEDVTFTGLTNFNAEKIWTDGNDIYYSDGSTQYVLQKVTNNPSRFTTAWTIKSWSGNNWRNVTGDKIWSDGVDIYCTYSAEDGYEYVLNRSTNSWDVTHWEGLHVYPSSIWTDGTDIYYSWNNANYRLVKGTHKWVPVTLYNAPDASSGSLAGYIFNYKGKAYHISGNAYSVFDKSTKTWLSRKANDSTIGGSYVWTDGDRLFSSFGNTSNELKFEDDHHGEIKKKRYTVDVSNWSNSTDASGYYTNSLTLSNPTLSPAYPPEVLPAGVDDSTFYTDTEKENFDKLEQCNLTNSTTLVLYAKEKPSGTFYVFVKGQVEIW